MAETDYNGWTNRETWAANLHLANDEGMYHAALEIAEQSRSARDCGESLVEYLQDLVETFPASTAGMVADIGSFWRINEHELGAAWVADLEEAGR